MREKKVSLKVLLLSLVLCVALPAADIRRAHATKLQGGISAVWSPAEDGFSFTTGKTKLITDVVENSPAFSAGLQKGDVILRVERTPLETGVYYERHGKKLFAKIKADQYRFTAETPALDETQTLLTGKVETLTGDTSIDNLFLQKMNPVPDNLRAGVVFDEHNLPACKCGGPWFILPDWAPGIWASAPSKSIETWQYDYKRKIRNEKPSVHDAKFLEAKTIGLIADQSGKVWHHPCVPYQFNQKVDQDVYFNEMIFAEPAPAGPDQFGFHWRWLSIKKDKNNVISNITQNESVAIFSKGEGNLENAVQTVKAFDFAGNPIEAHQTSYQKIKIQDFKPVEKWFGYDVRAMFAEYMANHKQ